MDMLLNLYRSDFTAVPVEGVFVKRAMAANLSDLTAFVRTHFSEGWAGEAMAAALRDPSACFIAQRGADIVGFSCYDATARGYFGPIGVLETERGAGIGEWLMRVTLAAMKENGYGYAVIGWVNDRARPFYERIGAFVIPDSSPAKTIYNQLK